MLIACMIGCGDADPDELTENVVAVDVPDSPGLEITRTGMVEPSNPEEASFMMEAAACEAIVTTYGMQGLEIGCPTTIKACPGLFRDSFGISCMQYDASTITTCLDNIEATTTCDELRSATCDVAPVWGSEPLGCTEPY